MSTFVVKRENALPVAGQDFLTLISPTNRRLKVISATCGGQGTSSAAQALVMSRSIAGATPGAPITPTEYENNEQATPVFTTATTWVAQPTPDANGEILPFNAMGGGFRWAAIGGRLMEARNAECISFRPPAGVTPQNMSLTVVVEEN